MRNARLMTSQRNYKRSGAGRLNFFLMVRATLAKLCLYAKLEIQYSDKNPDSSVGIATGYRLGVPGIESHCGARFFAPNQTSPGAHPASYTMGTGYTSPGSSGRGVAGGW